MSDSYSLILAPMVGLMLWTMIMYIWMYATRIPAILNLPKEKADEAMTPGKLEEHLPAKVQWKAHNYNHLHEQPTLFYAVCLVLAFLDKGDGINFWLAWAYVAFRIVHSIFQATINTTPRFVIFLCASICMYALIIRAALAVF